MAARTTITLEDDLDGSPAQETVQFALGATEYEIDLSTANASRFRAQLAPFTDHARTISRIQVGQARRSAATRRASAELRAWARQQGIEISARGRIPASITKQYQAATAAR